MRYLHLLLVCWLVVAVPTSAVASIINADHCQRMQDSQQMAGMDHAQHAAHMQSLKDTSPMQDLGMPENSGCTCGCACISAHCVASYAGLMGALLLESDFFNGPVTQAAYSLPGHLAAAHHLELLRPPTLS